MRSLLKPLASLRLTVVLLALTMIVVFAGTWAQIYEDVWTVQQQYFHSFFVWFNLQSFFHSLSRRVVVPLLPGGYLLITLLLLNLLAAHTVRFKLALKRSGIILIHAGLILLILGEVVTSLFQVEGHMRISEGQTVNFVEDVRNAEIAVIDPSPADRDIVTAIPAARWLGHGRKIDYPSLPFTITVEKYWPNSTVAGPFQARSGGVEFLQPTAGQASGFVLVEQPKATGTSGADSDYPSAVVSLATPDGQPLGRYVLTAVQLTGDGAQINAPQEINVGQKTYLIQLRWKRTYKPYAITLIDFKHDVYTGTETPKNFSSQVRLVDPSRNENREVLIWMNHPLRYEGETFYQSGFDGETSTILQVVRNPGWLIPYISCSIVTLGLLIHFGMTLIGFLSKRGNAPISTRPTSGRPGSRQQQQYVLKPQGGSALWPAIVTAACALYIFAAGRPPKIDSPFDLNAFGRIPISYEGRVMPLDTLARTSLRVMSGKSKRTGRRR